MTNSLTKQHQAQVTVKLLRTTRSVRVDMAMMLASLGPTEIELTTNRKVSEIELILTKPVTFNSGEKGGLDVRQREIAVQLLNLSDWDLATKGSDLASSSP